MGVNGSDGRRPGGVAENFGRKDRIRAGAVSGPWRSGPQAAAAPAPAPTPRPARVVPPPMPPVRAPEPEPASGPAAAVDALEAPVVSRKAPRGRLTGVWVAVAIGLVAAGAIVAAAVLLRPGTDRSTDVAAPVVAEAQGTAEPVAEPVAEPTPQPISQEIANPAAEPETAVEAAVDTGAIRLRVGPGVAEAQRAAIVAALEGAGYGPVQVEVLPFPIAASRVGYYRAEDAEAATALAEFVGGVSDPARTLSTRDYSQLLDGAAPGRLDIWIEG